MPFSLLYPFSITRFLFISILTRASLLALADSILEFAPFRVNVLNWLKIPPFKNLSGLEQTRSERKTGLVLFSIPAACHWLK